LARKALCVAANVEMLDLTPLLAVVFLAGGAAASEPTFFVGGIQVHEADHEHWARTLAGAGLNTVAVTVYAKQGLWNKAHLWWEDDEPAVLDEIRAARSAGLHVVLILRVAVDHAFEENRFIWHGMIMPDSHDEIRAWFDRYTRFVVKWARIAEHEGVDVLGVGSEMRALAATRPVTRYGNLRNYYGRSWYERLRRKRAREFADQIEARHLWVRGYPNYATLDEFLDARFELTRTWADEVFLRRGWRTLDRINERRRLILDCWTRLIAETRRDYHGLLSYAANFDNYENVGFWSQLDVIGINSYFSLRANLEDAADHAEQHEHFLRSWEGILGESLRSKIGLGLAEMPFLFTEIGYTFRRHSTVEPWAHDGFSVVGWKGHGRQVVFWNEQPIDYEERRLALAALAEAHRRASSDLIGILYWKLSTRRDHEEIEPFVTHVGPDSRDGLQRVLAGFVLPTSGAAAGAHKNID
jgi:hypothetical protein